MTTESQDVQPDAGSAETRIQARHTHTAPEHQRTDPHEFWAQRKAACGPACNCPPGTHQRGAHWPPPEEGETFVTKNGKVLTAADIQQLADEAEKGYDVTHLKTDPEPVYCGHRAPVDDCAGCAPVPGTVLRAKPRGDLACAGCPSIILEGVRHMVTAEGTHYHLGCYASLRYHQERGLAFPPERGQQDGKGLHLAARNGSR